MARSWRLVKILRRGFRSAIYRHYNAPRIGDQQKAASALLEFNSIWVQMAAGYINVRRLPSADWCSFDFPEVLA